MKNKIKILLAEDETSLAMIVKESLETQNFEVDIFSNGEEALKQFYNNSYDIVILDVMMPKKDGFEVAKSIRKTNQNIPIIFLTAKSQTEDVVNGFEMGGNDYLKKPFSIKELIVRIQSLINRFDFNHKQSFYQINSFLFDPTKQTLSYEGNIDILTSKESRILELLVQNKDNIVDRNDILKKLWGNDDIFSSRSLDVFITKIRKKLADDSEIKIINIRGIGYKIIW